MAYITLSSVGDSSCACVTAGTQTVASNEHTNMLGILVMCFDSYHVPKTPLPEFFLLWCPLLAEEQVHWHGDSWDCQVACATQRGVVGKVLLMVETPT